MSPNSNGSFWVIETCDLGQYNERFFRKLLSNDEQEWTDALASVDSWGSDLGIPYGHTPEFVSCLISVALRSSGRKRFAMLGSIDEMTCGRSVGGYSDEQRRWLRAAVDELALALRFFEALVETSPSRDEAEVCVGLLVYCAAHLPNLRPRVERFLAVCKAHRPDLVQEIDGVWEHQMTEPLLNAGFWGGGQP